jgi:hypothetical protein
MRSFHIVGVGLVEPHHGVEVAAGGEGAAGAGHDRAGDGRVLTGAVEGVGELVERLLTEGVLHLGTVDRDPGDVVLDLDEDLAVFV